MTADPGHPQAYKRELRDLSRRLQAAEEKAKALRHELDASFWRYHKEGINASALGQAAGIPTRTVRTALHRYQTNEIAGRAH